MLDTKTLLQNMLDVSTLYLEIDYTNQVQARAILTRIEELSETLRHILYEIEDLATISNKSYYSQYIDPILCRKNDLVFYFRHDIEMWHRYILSAN